VAASKRQIFLCIFCLAFVNCQISVAEKTFVPFARISANPLIDCFHMLQKIYARRVSIHADAPVENVTTGRPAISVVGYLYRPLFERFGEKLENLNGPVLDLGAGTTEVARYIDETYEKPAKQLDWWYGDPKNVWQVYSEDFSPLALLKFLKVNKKFLVAGVVQKLDFPDNSQGAVTSSHLMRHLPIEEALNMCREVNRVLQPGGIGILVPIMEPRSHAEPNQKRLLERELQIEGIRFKFKRMELDYDDTNSEIAWRLIIEK
jgi:SAM-dependent methyltransferase